MPILPFSKIDDMNAGMYKGEKISMKARAESIDNDASDFQSGEGGANPTSALHLKTVCGKPENGKPQDGKK